MRYARLKKIILLCFTIVTVFSFGSAGIASAWNDETHLAIARAAGYAKWYNAAGADMAKVKAGNIEAHNHYVNNPLNTKVTIGMVFAQMKNYNKVDPTGHLYGAILASVRDYREAKSKGRYGEYHLGFCAHYVGDLSQPLHNIVYDDYNRKYHQLTDGIINDEVLENLSEIEIYPISIKSEADLAREIARIANISIDLAKRLEAENRSITKTEAYVQISHSASLFRAILDYVDYQP